MPFSPVKKANREFAKFDVKRTEFIDLKEGTHRIRVLESDYKCFKTHYFNHNKVTAMCLGDECPVCQNNRALIMQFPNSFKDQTGYVKITTRFYINVLDKTPSKVCTCGKEYKGYAGLFCGCGEQLPEKASPLNKVKVLARGEGVFGDMDAIEKALLDETGEPIGLMNYDLNIVVRGSGRDTAYTIIADSGSREPVSVSKEDLFDLDKAVIKLTREELLDVQRGVALKDIFAARKGKEQTSTIMSEEVTQVSAQESADVRDAVAKLFQN